MAKNAPSTTIRHSTKSRARQTDRSTPWQTRLSKLINNVRFADDAASLRSDWSKVLADAPADQRHLLAPVPDILEQWLDATPPRPSDAQRQWHGFYESGKNALPSVIMEGVLRLFPKAKPGEAHWDRFLLECRKPPLVDVLLSRKLVRTQDLNRLARTHPHEFYQSAALDVLIRRRGLHDPTILLRESSAMPDRAPGLLPQDQIVLKWYLSKHTPKSDEQLRSILLDSPQIAAPVLDLLLYHRSNAVRFAQHLVSARHKRSKQTPMSYTERIDQMLMGWLARCDSELEKQASSRQLAASLVVGIIHLSLLTGADVGASNKDSNLAVATATLAKKAALLVLRAHEAQQPMSAAIVIQSHDLYHAVQEYLSQLHTGTKTVDGPPDRASRFQRYQGRREVIEQVLDALDSSADHDRIRDTLEAALFNLGVRSLEKADTTVTFNFREHESDTPGTLDGDPVTVLSPGRFLGDADARIVLVRAKVRPQP